MSITAEVFSEAEVEEIAIKTKEATKADVNKCVGTLEEEMETRTVTKKCKGIVVKSRTRGTGKGTLKLALHMAQDLFAKLYGMNRERLKDGVIAYGEKSVHPEFCMAVKLRDEDGKVKYKAYPNCVISKGTSRKVENGAEEIAEIELEIAVMPDENGEGLYEATETDLTEESLKEAWMENFTPDMVEAQKA